MKKTFTKLFAALALLVFMMPSMKAWATDVTFNYSDYKGEGGPSGSGSEYTMTKTDVSIGDNKFYGNSNYAHFYAGGVTTITPSSDVTITQIVLTASGTSYNGFQSGGKVTPSTGSVSANGTAVTWTGTANAAFTISHSKQIRWTSIVVTYTTSGGGGSTAVAPEFNPTGGAVKVGSTVIMSTTTDGGVIHYTTDGNAPDANSATYASPVAVNADMTIKAITIADGYNNSSVTTGTYKIVQHAGTEADPYTIADARIAIDAANGQTLNNKYVTGIVSQVDSYNDNYNSITYWISDDGTTTNQFEVYGGLSFVNGTAFSSINDIQVDDVVVVKGNIKYYSNSSVYEFEQNNNLVSLKYGAPTFYPVAGAVGSGTELTITDNHPNSTIYYTTDGYAPTTSSTPYNPSSKPTITTSTTFKAIAVKITNDGDDNYIQSDVADASYTILASVATPVITLDGGTYTFAQTTAITCGTEGATIHYTTNGDNPTTSSTAYTGAISINETMTIKAIAAMDGMANSAVAEASYTINIPAINAENVNIAYDATSGTITSTITNAVDGGALTAAITGGNEGTWLSLGQVDGLNVPLTCSTNEGNANRTATVTLTYTYSGDHIVTKNVTVTQAKYVKDYADLPFEFDGGRADIATTTGLTQDGLDSDYGSSPKLKFNSAGDCVILKINETPGKLTFDIKGNSLGGTYKFSVMQSANGTDYTALKEYTSIGSSTSSETLTPASTTRYIKWVYTTKDNGNVALGNIKLKAPEPTITIFPESVDVLASGVLDATLSLTYERLEINEAGDFDIQFCDENGDELTPAPDWITAKVIDGTSDDYVVSYKVEENDDEERTAYFKVFAFGNEDYVYSNLVTVTQAAYVAPENKYIRFSGELIEGDYLIVYNGGAMNNTVTSDRIQYKEVIATNNVIATDDNTIIWHIAKSGNYWTIKNKNDNKYAASNGKNKAQMLDDGTADVALWTITGTTTYDFENKARAVGTDPGNKWLRKNGTYGFACYASSTGGALSLYIKNCVLPVTNDELTERTEIPEGNITVYDDLTIPSDEDVVLTVYGTLEVQGTLTNTVPSHLIVKEGGQLIIPAAKADPVKATFQREIEGYAITEGKDNYYLIANPTTTELDPEDDVEYMLSNEYDLFYFDESQEGEEWRNYKQDAFNLENRKGYLYANNKAVTLEFAGTVPTGTSANITLSKTDDNTYAGFNLVGNPMSVNITSMVINSTECSYYKLDPSYGTFGVSTDPIIVGEAFMVEALSDGATLSLNPGLKGESDFNNDVIRLEVSNNKYTDVAYLYFGNHLPLTKINHLNDEAPMLYIHTESANQAVAVMNERSEVKTVNVNFEAKTMGMYTISAKADKDNFSYMHLYDRLTGADTDLLISDYTFIGSTTDATGRFILRFEAIDNNSESESFAYQNGSDIIINGEGELQIFDVMGRMISTQNVNGRETVNVSAQGVYIFRLNGMTQKIVVR